MKIVHQGIMIQNSTNTVPTISIIVPVYKVEPYLRRCVDSILAQTFSDFELILVDDGSPDNCPAICDEYAQNDNRIKVIHKENGGLSSARNAGLDIANGKFIMFCDSDDYYTSNTCELMYEAIINKPNAWVFCNICRVDENDIPLTDSNSEIAHKKFLNSPTYFTAFELSLSGSCCNKIYNHEIIRKHKIRFDETIRFAEDVPFDTPYCLKTDSKIFIASPLYFYRVVNSSLTHSYHSDHLGIYIKLFKIRLPLIKENEIADFCDIYFHYFVTLLDNTMDKRNPISFLQKMRYNDKMMKTEEFSYCVAHASGKNDSAIFMHVVRMHNYYIYWLFQKICKLKEKFKRKPKKY